MKNSFNKSGAVKQNRLFIKKEVILVFTVLALIFSCSREEELATLQTDLLSKQIDSARAHDTLLLRLKAEEKNSPQ